jgi:tripartite-type tricarboxylate transporter receptor subunit TctC
MKTFSINCSSVLFALTAIASQGALAQAYPARPIRMLLPQTPGAGVDLILRRAAEELRPRLGQPIVVENHPGGNQVVAADLCAKAAPDGYTLCTVSMDTTSINPLLFAKLPYSPKDLKPIVNLYTILGGMFTKASLPANSMAELHTLASSKPAALNYAMLGANTITDMSRLWLEQKWKVHFSGIPYKGGPQIFGALVAGEVDVSWQGVYGGISLLKDRKIKLLAVSGSKRLPQYPDVPTLRELGLGDFPSAGAWWGIFGQAALPAPIVTRINTEVVRLFHDPKFVDFLNSLVTESSAGTPEEFAAVIRHTDALIGQLVKEFNIPKH